MVQYLNNGASGFEQFKAARAAKTDDGKPKFSSVLTWIVIVALGGWLIYSWMMPNTKNEKRETKDEIAAAQVDDISKVPAATLDGKLLTARVQGLRLSQIQLKDFKEKKVGDQLVTLLSGDREFAEFGFSGNGTTFPTATTVWSPVKTETNDGAMHFSWTSPEGVVFNRIISISGDSVVQIKDMVKNNGKVPVTLSPYARIVRAAEVKNQVGVKTGGIAFANDRIEREDWKYLTKHPQSYQTAGGFVGFTDQYWQTVARIAGSSAADETMRLRQRADGMYQADVAPDTQTIAPGAEYTWTSSLYAGAKTQSNLGAAAAVIPGIDQTIDYGWFWFLARPMLWALTALVGFVGNYGVAIILFTILLRILMWPLTKKSFTGMAAMQRMQPEMARIQKTYANDKLRMQSEMTALYKRHGANPMSGCLPMLLQIPIFFALYKALLISVPMRQASFLWITDLSVMDPLFILPIIMGATMWLQQYQQTSYNKMTTAANDANNPMAQTQKFMKWMPILFTVMFAMMPAGLVLYWAVSNLFGIGQMWWIKKSNK
ncbi:MAG: membrane protein insertase YidC [Proteobacteria bacterium]|nr:membrane protein insertase YidC [Pseudomonadota bacterium]